MMESVDTISALLIFLLKIPTLDIFGTNSRVHTIVVHMISYVLANLNYSFKI